MNANSISRNSGCTRVYSSLSTNPLVESNKLNGSLMSRVD